MHGEVPLSSVAIAIGLGVRYAVPLVCAAIAIDAARRPPAAFGSFGRAPWVGLSLSLLVSLVIGFIVPGVGVLQLVAIAAVPLAFVLALGYLLAVVFPRSSPEISREVRANHDSAPSLDVLEDDR